VGQKKFNVGSQPTMSFPTHDQILVPEFPTHDEVSVFLGVKMSHLEIKQQAICFINLMFP
jgi:hypothetical protein